MKENETKIEEVVNENIYNQPELCKTIKTIPGHHRYYNCIEKIENLSLMTLNKEKLTKPTNQTNQTKQPKYIRTYRPPIGNQTLESRIELLKNKKPNSVNETIETYQSHIDEALHKLREVNIVNYHVCIQNVMYSEIHHCPIIANFDYSFKMDDMYSSLETQTQSQTLLETIFKNPVPKTANVEAKLIHEIITNYNGRSNLRHFCSLCWIKVYPINKTSKNFHLTRQKKQLPNQTNLRCLRPSLCTFLPRKVCL